MLFITKLPEFGFRRLDIGEILFYSLRYLVLLMPLSRYHDYIAGFRRDYGRFDGQRPVFDDPAFLLIGYSRQGVFDYPGRVLLPGRPG
jgi:hypothetical protein